MANENSIPFVDLYAASKIIGRECATQSKAYMQCKYDKGQNPELCLKEAESAMRCTENVVNALNSGCPEFQIFKECIDLYDFQNYKCRKFEKPVYDFWNTKMGYTTPTIATTAAAEQTNQHH